VGRQLEPEYAIARKLRLGRKKLKALLPEDLQKPDSTVSELRSL